jgi:hypothetical protein
VVEVTVTAIGLLTVPGAIEGIGVGFVVTDRQGVVVHVTPVMAPIVSSPVPVFSRQKNCTLLPPALIDHGLAALVKLVVE